MGVFMWYVLLFATFINSYYLGKETQQKKNVAARLVSVLFCLFIITIVSAKYKIGL